MNSSNVLLSVCVASAMHSGTDPGAPQSPSDGSWNAQWIGIDISRDGGSEKNLWTCFRKEILLPEKPKVAMARIAVDSKYWLWINGKLVVYEGGLKRGPNPRDTYFDVIDLSRFLRKGKNTFAVLTWFWGKPGFSHNDSGKAGFLFDLQADQTRHYSDASWKARRHPAFGATGEPNPNFRMQEENVHFDARRDIGSWTKAAYDDSTWTSATTFGSPPSSPWNQLVKRDIPQWRVSPLTRYENDREICRISDGKPIIAKLPRNITISPYLKIRAKAGLVIDMRTDNYKGGGEYNFRSEYITRDGVQEFESLPYLNGHWMIYTIPAGVEILELRYRETRYDTDWVGKFSCDDPFLNSLWMKSLYTMNVNMRDAIQDPDRERAQWWGDVVILMNQILFSCDQRAIPLVRKSIFNLVDWQKPDGVLFSPVPASSWDKELPLQMLASIGEKGFWNYYEQTGDKEIISYAYPAIKRYLSLWKLGPNGLAIHRPGGWDWADWGENIDMPVIENAWLFQALGAASKMAALTDNASDIPGYDQMRASIELAYNKTLWNGKEYRSPGYTGATDERGHALTVLFGLADQKQYKAIKDVYTREFHSSPYMEKYVLESLFEMQDSEAALRRMKGRYQKMVESTYTTLWEVWGISSEGHGGGSYNHGWSGGPLALMMQYVAGVSSTSPGYSTYQVKPQLGHLNRVVSTMNTVKGLIQVEIERSSETYTLTLKSPRSTSAFVELPLSEFAGKAFFVNGKPLAKVGKIRRSSDGKALIVPPGEWKFELR